MKVVVWAGLTVLPYLVMYITHKSHPFYFTMIDCNGIQSFWCLKWVLFTTKYGNIFVLIIILLCIYIKRIFFCYIRKTVKCDKKTAFFFSNDIMQMRNVKTNSNTRDEKYWQVRTANACPITVKQIQKAGPNLIMQDYRYFQILNYCIFL